jgi:predicted nucleic acid-binding protein
LTKRPSASVAARLTFLREVRAKRNRQIVGGNERTSTRVEGLVDANVLVYRLDSRFPSKRRIATELLRRGVAGDSTRLPHQTIVNFVAAASRRQTDGSFILSPEDARREAEELLNQFEILYSNELIVRLAPRGAAAYQLAWFEPTSGLTRSTTALRSQYRKTSNTTVSTALYAVSILFADDLPAYPPEYSTVNGRTEHGGSLDGPAAR